MYKYEGWEQIVSEIRRLGYNVCDNDWKEYIEKLESRHENMEKGKYEHILNHCLYLLEKEWLYTMKEYREAIIYFKNGDMDWVSPIGNLEEDIKMFKENIVIYNGTYDYTYDLEDIEKIELVDISETVDHVCYVYGGEHEK